MDSLAVFQWLLITLTVSLDGFWAGAGLGAGKDILSRRQLAAVGVTTLFCTLLAASAGRWLGVFLSARVLAWTGALLLFGLGISYMKPQKRSEAAGMRNSILLGLGVAADASVAAFSLGSMGMNILMIALGMAVMHVLCVGAGNRLGGRIALKIHVSLQSLGGLLLMALAVLRVV